MFCKKCVLRNFAKFTGKRLCQSLFLNKVAGLVSVVSNILFKKSGPEVFCIKGVLKISAKFTRKYLCLSLCLSRVTSWRPLTLLKNRLRHRCFLVIFPQKFKNAFLHKTPVRMLFTWKKFFLVKVRSYRNSPKAYLGPHQISMMELLR